MSVHTHVYAHKHMSNVLGSCACHLLCGARSCVERGRFLSARAVVGQCVGMVMMVRNEVGAARRAV
jgi:hypothetical protein